MNIIISNINKYNIIISYKYNISTVLKCLIICFIIVCNKKKISVKKIFDGEILQKSKTKMYLNHEIIKQFNNYIKICFNHKLINKTKYPLIKKPKISVIMPIYNGGKYLTYSLSSIQNQNIKDIEIILIDDFSTDDSIKIIEEYMKNDPRIRLIKNKDNKKILYSKSMAALNSKGEYIIQLDQDDIFIREDSFQSLYNEAKQFNLEIVQMRDFVKKEFFFKKRTLVNLYGLHFIYPKSTHYKKQPELKRTLFADNNNYLLWGLLIKTDLYKKSIYHLWPIIMNYKIIFNEDYIITSMIAKLAENYKYINKFILIHLMHSKSISSGCGGNKEFYLTLYFYIYYLNEYFVKIVPQDIKIIINYIYTDIIGFPIGINLFPEIFDSIIKIIMNSEYLLYTEKEEFLNKFNLDINKYKNYTTYKYMMTDNEFKNIKDFQNSIKTIKNYNHNNKLKGLINSNFEISIIIYCLEFKFLNKTINSILKQIKINNYIKYLINEYENIKIINNNETKGILYSYSKGVLNAKGEYILFLQPGYTLAKNNILSYIYNVANYFKLDILEFNLLINNHEDLRNNSLRIYKCLHFESNKDFNIIKINKQYKDIDQEKELLFNKLIKTKIYKKIIYDYKLNKYNIKLFNYYEDILFFLLKKYRLKFRYIDEFGIIQKKDNIDLLKLNNISNNKNQVINDSIFYINYIFDNSENTFKDKKYVLQEFINNLSIIYNKFIEITNNSIKLLEKFINCNFINKKDKIELLFFYNSLIN